MKNHLFVFLMFSFFCKSIFAMGVYDVSFSPNGRNIAIVGSERNDNGIFTYMMEFNVSNGELNKVFYGEIRDVYERCLEYSSDGNTIVVGSINSRIMLWGSNGNPIKYFDGHEGGVNSVAFSPDGKTIISGATDNTIKLWDIESGRLIRTIIIDGGNVNKVVYSPDGRTIIAGLSNGLIRIWNPSNGNLVRTFTGHTESVNSIAISPDGKTIVSGSLDKTVKLWDTDSGRIKISFIGDERAVNSVVISPDGRTFAYGGTGDGVIKICDIVTGNEIRRIPGASDLIRCIEFSPDGRLIAQATFSSVVLWDVASGNYISSIPNNN